MWQVQRKYRLREGSLLILLSILLVSVNNLSKIEIKKCRKTFLAIPFYPFTLPFDIYNKILERNDITIFLFLYFQDIFQKAKTELYYICGCIYIYTYNICSRMRNVYNSYILHIISYSTNKWQEKYSWI